MTLSVDTLPDQHTLLNRIATLNVPKNHTVQFLDLSSVGLRMKSRLIKVSLLDRGYPNKGNASVTFSVDTLPDQLTLLNRIATLKIPKKHWHGFYSEILPFDELKPNSVNTD